MASVTWDCKHEYVRLHPMPSYTSTHASLIDKQTIAVGTRMRVFTLAVWGVVRDAPVKGGSVLWRPAGNANFEGLPRKTWSAPAQDFWQILIN